MDGILDEIKASFRRGGIVIQLIYINLGVFLAIRILWVILTLSNLAYLQDPILRFLAVPADLSALIIKPWTLFTYMFLHEGFFHILFNLLWLYWFGRIFLQYLNPKQLLNTYILGGLAGAVLYILMFNILPVFEPVVSNAVALGASAAVMAIAITISVYAPDYTINLIFIGPVKLKYLALVFIITDVLQIASTNAGGHIAHLGGAIFGILYAQQYKKGNDFTMGFSRIMDKITSVFKPRSRMRVSYRRSKDKVKQETDWEYNQRRISEQEEIDRILDKIAKSGYESLSKREKEVLFKAGSNK
jgi:membrane associated rhomboid family serine protease